MVLKKTTLTTAHYIAYKTVYTFICLGMFTENDIVCFLNKNIILKTYTWTIYWSFVNVRDRAISKIVNLTIIKYILDYLTKTTFLMRVIGIVPCP